MSGCCLSQTWSQKETDTLVCVSCLLRGNIFFPGLKRRASGCVGLPLPGRVRVGTALWKWWPVELGWGRGSWYGEPVKTWTAATQRGAFPSLFLLPRSSRDLLAFFFPSAQTHTQTEALSRRWACLHLNRTDCCLKYSILARAKC